MFCDLTSPSTYQDSAESIDSRLISVHSPTATRCWEGGCDFRHKPTFNWEKPLG
jgi:hypothetical protein